MNKDDFALMAFEPGKRYVVLLDSRSVDRHSIEDYTFPQEFDVTFIFCQVMEGMKISDMARYTEMVASSVAVELSVEICARIAEEFDKSAICDGSCGGRIAERIRDRKEWMPSK